VHGSVSALIDENGSNTAVTTYGYTPYGQPDPALTSADTGSATEPADRQDALNPYRYSAKRLDPGSGTYDMGARRFGPDTSRFLQPDFYRGALADLSLALDPLGGNRYALAGANPVAYAEADGHRFDESGNGTGTFTPNPTDTGVRTSRGWHDFVQPSRDYNSPDASLLGAVGPAHDAAGACAIGRLGFRGIACEPGRPIKPFPEPQPEPFCLKEHPLLCTLVAAALPTPAAKARLGEEGSVGALNLLRRLFGRTEPKGGAAPVLAGQAGERAVREFYDIGEKIPIRVNGRTRIPDGLTASTLSEVKNVESLSYTQQLRDFAQYGQNTQRTFYLYVPPSTRLSQPLQQAIGAGAPITLRFIP
jgi:RHS repeat-associated protein